MALELSDGQVALLREKHFAELVTLMADGSPQVSPVWVDTDGTNVLINTAMGRLKTRNVERDPRVAVAVMDPEAPYEKVLNIRGRVVQMITDGADDHIDSLAKKYLGVDSYPNRTADEERVILRIEVDRTSGGA